VRETDNASRDVQVTPHRVTLDSILKRIKHIEYITPATMPHMTIALVHVDNGFAFVGKSAPADEQNYDQELGQRFSREDAIRQIWSHEAYLLREAMSL
jgi:hypothetical protein